MAAEPVKVKLYGWAISPFVSRALLCLEEAGVDYELVAMDHRAGDQRRPDHLARNVSTLYSCVANGTAVQYHPHALSLVVRRRD
jgi:glutathione S-transferase